VEFVLDGGTPPDQLKPSVQLPFAALVQVCAWAGGPLLQTNAVQRHAAIARKIED
jgi:hypothetical protein